MNFAIESHRPLIYGLTFLLNKRENCKHTIRNVTFADFRVWGMHFSYYITCICTLNVSNNNNASVKRDALHLQDYLLAKVYRLQV